VRSVNARWILSTDMMRAKVCMSASARKTQARRNLANASHQATQTVMVVSNEIVANIWRGVSDVSIRVMPPNNESSASLQSNIVVCFNYESVYCFVNAGV
jgi:hypothetical protein